VKLFLNVLLQVGTKVSVNPNCCCGKCDWNKEGLINFCENNASIGVKSNGGWAEYCVVPQNLVSGFKLPTCFCCTFRSNQGSILRDYQQMCLWFLVCFLTLSLLKIPFREIVTCGKVPHGQFLFMTTAIGVREGILLEGRKKFALKTTIFPKNRQLALKLTF